MKYFALLAVFLALPAFAQTHTVHITLTASVVDATHDAPTAYKLFKGATPTGPFTKIADLTTASLAFDDTGLGVGVYYYTASAVNLGGESAQTSPMIVTINSQKPNVPGTMTCRFDLTTTPPTSNCTTP